MIARLRGRHQVARDTLAFRFEAEGFHFRPGQNADFAIPGRGTHTFSLASSPDNASSIMIATRMRPTPFKRALADLPPGATIEVQPATGGFTLPEDPEQPVVMLAGGIGITPFRSMLKWLVDEDLQTPVWLFHSNPDPAATPFLPELHEWGTRIPLMVVPTVTSEADASWPFERGRIDEDMLRRHLPPAVWGTGAFYVAGPPHMVRDLAQMLAETGVDEARIHRDEFSGYANGSMG